MMCYSLETSITQLRHIRSASLLSPGWLSKQFLILKTASRTN